MDPGRQGGGHVLSLSATRKPDFRNLPQALNVGEALYIACPTPDES